MPGSSKWSLSVRFPHQNPVYTTPLPLYVLHLEVMLAVIQCRIFCLQVCYQNIQIKIHRTIILPVVLYGCGTLSLTLREERRLRVFENRVLRRIFGDYEGQGNRGMEKTA
jgi:hypothetical protein